MQTVASIEFERILYQIRTHTLGDNDERLTGWVIGSESA